MNKKLKITLITLIMVLICLIGFGGIYVQKKGKFKNIIPDYELGTKIEGLRETTFKIDDSTNEKKLIQFYSERTLDKGSVMLYEMFFENYPYCFEFGEEYFRIRNY